MQTNKSYELVMKKMMFVSVLPFIVLAVCVRLFTSLYLENHLFEMRNNAVNLQVSHLNEQLSQLEIGLNYFTFDVKSSFIEPLSTVTYKQSENIQELSDKLFIYENSNILIKKISIMFPKVENNEYVPIVRSSGNLNQKTNKTWIKFLTTQNLKTGWYLDEGKIYYIQSFNTQNGQQIIMLAELNVSILMNQLENSSIEENINFLFINDERIKLSALGEYNFSKLKKDSSGYRIVEVNSKRLNSQWKIVSFYPIKAVLAPLVLFSNVIVIIALIIIVVLLILEFKIYGNFKAYAQQKLKKIFGANDELLPKNEFDMIESQWQKLSNNNVKLKKQLENNYESLAVALFQQISSGYVTKESLPTVEHELTLLGYDVKQGLTAINVLFSTKRPQEFIDELRNLTGQYVKHFLVIPESCYSFDILLFENSHIELFDNLNSFTNSLNDFQDGFMTIVLGRKRYDINDFRLELQSLYAFRTYRKMKEENQIIAVDNDIELSSIVKNPNIEIEFKKLIDVIDYENDVAIKEQYMIWMDNVLEENTYQFMIIQEVRKLLEKLKKTLGEIHLILPDNQIHELFRKLTFITDIHEIKLLVWSVLINPLILEYGKEKQVRVEQAVRKLKEYIDNNYMDRNLSLEERAESFSVDLVQLSKTFKKMVGMNYIEYLTLVRMERAKQLLSQTVISIKDISESVGYEPTYFNRVFKKYYKMTPGQYRKANIIDNKN